MLATSPFHAFGSSTSLPSTSLQFNGVPYVRPAAPCANCVIVGGVAVVSTGALAGVELSAAVASGGGGVSV
jgi:hypothetical protein